jgi:pyroglutamyl-peptidase
MRSSALLTSFTTWEPHHITNSSDDLLAELTDITSSSLYFLRKIPVDFHLAPSKVLTRFNELKPKILICCGMAEEHKNLSIESRAVLGDEVIHTELDLNTLTKDLTMTEISDDAGGFVCNTLYFKALSHLSKQQANHYCLFAHIPVLTESNISGIKSDFLTVLQRLSVIDDTLQLNSYCSG